MLHFTIRDLLWLTVAMALGLAWWVDRVRLTERIDALTPKAFPLINPILGRITIREEDESLLGIELPDPSAPAQNPPKN